jgi:hypothetical protein
VGLWAAGAVALLGAAAAGSGCADCDDEPTRPPVARLVDLTGGVERRAGGAWAAASHDEGAHVGDAVKTGPTGGVTVVVLAGGQLRLGPRALVEIVAVGGALALRIGAGQVEVDAQGAMLRLALGGGSDVVVLRGGKMTLGEDGQLSMTLGEGTLETVAGVRELSEGAMIKLTLGDDGRLRPGVVDAGFGPGLTLTLADAGPSGADPGPAGAPEAGPDAAAQDAAPGDAPAGDVPVGDVPAGDVPVGDVPAGDVPVGDGIAGDAGAAADGAAAAADSGPGPAVGPTPGAGVVLVDPKRGSQIKLPGDKAFRRMAERRTPLAAGAAVKVGRRSASLEGPGGGEIALGKRTAATWAGGRCSSPRARPG